MMVLIFKVGDDRYGLNVSNVIEIIPCVPLKQLPHSPDYLAGLLNYRSDVVPVIDLAYLIGGERVNLCLSSRIVIVNPESPDWSSIGVLVGNATEIEKIPDSLFTSTKLDADNHPIVDKVALDGDGMLKHIDPVKIVPEEIRSLFNPVKEDNDGLEEIDTDGA